MELKILDKKDESLLSRINIKAEATFQGVTPSKEELQKQIASSLKVDEKLIVIKNVKTFFGQEKVRITAFQYESEGALKNIEPKKKEKAEKKEDEAAPAETKKPAAGAPKGEKKEEAPKEEKPKEEETKG